MNNPAGDVDREGEFLCMKIKAGLEDLLSDSHLAEDGFLLKHVLKNKQRYVSLKLLTCLKKIKVLTTNWHVTRAAAECSDLLEVNDERTKVRRIEPLPKWLLCSPTSRLLLAWNISVENTEPRSLSERILRKFSVYGHVTSIWILHPGEELPKELQCYAKHHKELGPLLCAVVKFDNLEEVRKAYSRLKAEERHCDGEGMRVAPLGFHHEMSEENKEQPEDIPSQENTLRTSEDSVKEEPSVPVKDCDKTPDTFQPQKSLDNCTQRASEQISTSCNSRSFPGLKQRYSKESCCSGDGDKTNAQSRWVLRRVFAANALNPKVARVLRQPFGPDGTEGFQRQAAGRAPTLSWK